MSYGISTTVTGGFDDIVEAVRAALAEQGFGVLTEFDLAATLKAKLDVDVARQVVLGACNPPLAHAALRAEENIGLLLPCNVVVRDGGEGRVVVAALDPAVMVEVTDNADLRAVADDAAARLRAALEAVSGA
ncbi:DUF302 domain-containing protein [Cellulomonas fimi]|uniref:DUF302 domain-containing protein n=1 Tax=Cellulomonas fimi TaxID=1708 RepID=A0A7Y0QJC8_CELFI|nr:DUF302 domain-containing protein [Cellulomonas fimi]NMR21227.1 DUF302 domain-containing protein [Cellulomonas fimi]